LSSSLFIKNRQRSVPLNPRALRHLARLLIRDLLHVDDYDLAIYLVGQARMRQVNEQYLHHRGSTDVITFDYTSPPGPGAPASSPPCPVLHGEIFICPSEAVAQARRFRTRWQSEVVRYVIHALLHLRGFDDHRAEDRRRMKREEDRLLKNIDRLYPVRKVGVKPGASLSRGGDSV
jgi:probable rRNA maturation factor